MDSAAPNLFSDALEPGQIDQAHVYEQLLLKYIEELLEHPPIVSLRPSITPDLYEREKIAAPIARKDVARVLLVLRSLSEDEIAAVLREDAERAQRRTGKQQRTDRAMGKAA